MNILHTVQYYYPSVGGMQEVVKQLSERLVKKNHQVTVATSKDKNRKINKLNGVSIREFDISGNLVYGLRGEVRRYQDFLVNTQFDIIINFAAQQCLTDTMLIILDKIDKIKVFVPTGFSALYLFGFKNYFTDMKHWLTKYDMNIFLSQRYRDIEFARSNDIVNYKIIPNGASEEEFLAKKSISIREKFNIPKEHILILHVGSHMNDKGHSETIEIFARAAIKNTTLLLVGNSFSGGCQNKCKIREFFFNTSGKNKSIGKKLIVTELLREETVAAYHEADLFLFSSHIECSPLVLYECMASKIPFLSTDVGNANELIDKFNCGILLPTQIDKSGYSHVIIGKSVEILESIINNDKKRARMARYGYDAWKKYFTWEIITSRYEQLYKSLIDQN